MLEIRQRHDPLQIFKYSIPAFEPLEWLNKSDHCSLYWLVYILIMILVIAINLPLQYVVKVELLMLFQSCSVIGLIKSF